MSYSTPAMVRQALVPTSDGHVPSTPTNSGADLTDAQLTALILEADTTIDSYIAGIYAVPVTLDGGGNVPHPIDYWSRNIAAYLAMSIYSGQLPIDSKDPIYLRYLDTLESMKSSGNGHMKLQLPHNNTGMGSTGAGPVHNPYIGDLWTPDDFDVTPFPGMINGGWPFWSR